MSLAVQSQYIVNRTGYGTASVVHYLIMNGIHPDYRINAVQATGTPCLYFRKYTIGDGTNRLSRHTITQVLLHPVTYLTCAVSQSIKSDDAVCNTFRKNGFTLFYELGIKGGVTVTRGRYGDFSHRSLYLFLHLAITTVATHAFILRKMSVHLTFKGSI